MDAFFIWASHLSVNESSVLLSVMLVIVGLVFVAGIYLLERLWDNL